MQEQEKPTTETVHLPTGGSIPGIPGQHGPGTYIINWIERTITRVEEAVESAIERVEEALHPESASLPEVPQAPMPTEPVTVPEQAPLEHPVTSKQPE